MYAIKNSEKLSQNMFSQKPVLTGTFFILFYLLASYQFYENYSLYLDLTDHGKITSTEVEYFKSWGSWNYRLTFQTKDGKRIISEGKCGDYEDCRNEYYNMEVIYLPQDPEDFMELPSFLEYSLTFTIFFYFVLYGITGGILSAGFAYMTFLFIKNRKRIIRYILER